MRPPAVIVDCPIPVICRWRSWKGISKSRHFRRRLPPSHAHTELAFGARTGARRTRTPRSARPWSDVRGEDAIAIVDEEALGMTAGQSFSELLHRPFRRGIRGDVVVGNLAGSDLHDDEDVEGAEAGGDHHEEVTGHHGLGMMADKGQPALFRLWRPHWTVSMEVLPDGAWGNLNGQRQVQLVGDAFLSPGGI